MWLIAIVFILAAISLGLALREQEKDKAVLRHTIQVNLSILRPELARLSAFAEQQEQSAKVKRARSLLTMSSVLAMEVERNLDAASERELGEKLSLAFRAMSISTQAHHLLQGAQTVNFE